MSVCAPPPRAPGKHRAFCVGRGWLPFLATVSGFRGHQVTGHFECSFPGYPRFPKGRLQPVGTYGAPRCARTIQAWVWNGEQRPSPW